MGRVVEFKSTRIVLPAPTGGAAGAKVVIFPGVRIERRGVEAEHGDEVPSGEAARPRSDNE